MTKKIQTILFTGHLGSGKTTLINKLINQFPEKKFALIENEFGEEGIDGELLETDQEIVFEMNNGCLCCSVKGDMVRIMEGILKDKRDQVDTLLIEATGVADPARVAEAFLFPSPLSKDFELSSVICVVDGLHYDKHRTLEEFEKQIVFADQYYISKVDTLTSKQIDEIGLNLNEHKIIHYQDEKIDWAFDATFFSDISEIEEEHGHCHHGHDHDHDHDHHHHHDHNHDHDHHHDHDHNHHNYESLSLTFDREFSQTYFEAYLNILFMQYRGKIIRTKGFIYLDRTENPLIFQGVYDSLEFREKSKPTIDRKSRIVIIGQELNKEIIAKGFENCMVR